MRLLRIINERWVDLQCAVLDHQWTPQPKSAYLPDDAAMDYCLRCYRYRGNVEARKDRSARGGADNS